jgi:predicted ATPase
VTDPRLCPVLVGREDVLAVARRRWTTAAGGAGHVLFLAGEAGIGKTRSIREILAEVRAAGGRTVAAAAHPHDAETVGGLLAESAAALRRTGDAGFADAGELLADRLGSGACRHNATDLADAILRLASPARPALLVLEDLHWADSLTLDVLDRVATGVPGTPLLILGSYRPTSCSRARRSGPGERACSRSAWPRSAVYRA